ncbi:MAG: hypothetical protein ACLP7P_11845 [Rhodomicrobium sp.]
MPGKSRTFAPFYNFDRDVLQTWLIFVLCSSRLAGGLPLQNSRRKLLLIHLPRIMRDHATRKTGDRRHFCIRASGFEQKHDGRFPQTVENKLPLAKLFESFALHLVAPRGFETPPSLHGHPPIRIEP